MDFSIPFCNLFFSFQPQGPLESREQRVTSGWAIWRIPSLSEKRYLYVPQTSLLVPRIFPRKWKVNRKPPRTSLNGTVLPFFPSVRLPNSITELAFLEFECLHLTSPERLH